MAHSPRYEARLEAAWRDLIASVDALCAELKTAPPRARRPRHPGHRSGLDGPGGVRRAAVPGVRRHFPAVAPLDGHYHT